MELGCQESAVLDIPLSCWVQNPDDEDEPCYEHGEDVKEEGGGVKEGPLAICDGDVRSQ